MKRAVFYISDATGLSIETIGHSLLTQFSQIDFEYFTLPFIDSVEKANEAVSEINKACKEFGTRALVFSTMINTDIRDVLMASDGYYLDFFQTFVQKLEHELSVDASDQVGYAHSANDYKKYMDRIDAVNFAIGHDDGLKTKNYHQADIILIGVSRVGKTPTCLYMALQYGFLVANFPFTEDELDSPKLPAVLAENHEKLFGLSIDPERLCEIRQTRFAQSNYSSLKQCRYEIQLMEAFYQREGIPFIDTTQYSIEEIATKILANKGLKRRFT